VLSSLKLTAYTCDTFDAIAQAATKVAIADETKTIASAVDVKAVGCEERRLSEGDPSLSVQVHIGVDDATAGNRIGLALIAVQKDSSTFVQKFREYVAADGGTVPDAFTATVPAGSVQFEGASLSGTFQSLQDCRSATKVAGVEADLRCCLKRSPRAFQKRAADMKAAFVVKAEGSSSEVAPAITWELCIQSPKKAWAF